MPDSFIEAFFVNNYQIRDILTHDPASDPNDFIVRDVHSYRYIIIKLSNTHDQIIRVQVMSNIGVSGSAIRTAALVLPSRLGAPIDVQINDSEIRTVGEGDLSSVPLLYIRATALVLPTTGALTVAVHGFGPGAR